MMVTLIRSIPDKDCMLASVEMSGKLRGRVYWIVLNNTNQAGIFLGISQHPPS